MTIQGQEPASRLFGQERLIRQSRTSLINSQALINQKNFYSRTCFQCRREQVPGLRGPARVWLVRTAYPPGLRCRAGTGRRVCFQGTGVDWNRPKQPAETLLDLLLRTSILITNPRNSGLAPITLVPGVSLMRHGVFGPTLQTH